MEILRVITHADGGEKYALNAVHYPSNEDSVDVKGYGVCADNPETTLMQFNAATRYYGNEGKNQFIHLMISFSPTTAPDAETAMAITDKVLEPFKENHLILSGVHHKHRDGSDFHTHSFICTTNLKNGKLLHPTNTINYPLAQSVADITQQNCQLIIERKKIAEQMNGLATKENSPQNTEYKDFTKVFRPHKCT